jgi:hypothetical protein
MTAWIYIDGEVISITEAMHRFAERERKKRKEKENDGNDFGGRRRNTNYKRNA